MVRAIPYRTCDSGEQQVIGPSLQPTNQVPQGNAQNRCGERDRVEARISKAPDEEQAFSVRVGGLERAKRRTSGAGERRLRLLEALLLEPAKDRLWRREGQRKPEAAASHRREQALGLRGDEKENRGRRRLLQVFQQRVLCVRVHRFCGIDQDDAQTRPMRSHGEEVGELAYLLDADLLALLLRGLRALLAGLGRHALGHDQPEVGVIAERKPVAGAAGAAGPLARPRILAQQRLRARLSEFELAQALAALE